jgi:hypothetical protein
MSWAVGGPSGSFATFIGISRDENPSTVVGELLV